MGKRPTNTQDR
jgi:hypothetical protein